MSANVGRTGDGGLDGLRQRSLAANAASATAASASARAGANAGAVPESNALRRKAMSESQLALLAIAAMVVCIAVTLFFVWIATPKGEFNARNQVATVLSSGFANVASMIMFVLIYHFVVPTSVSDALARLKDDTPDVPGV